jgi:dynein heavy chain
MGGVVDKMRSELRSVMGQSVRDYPSKPRDKWMFDWPSQVALVGGRGLVAVEQLHAVAGGG